jgi:hypothetical protein
LDLTGDGVNDLVLTRDGSDSGVGNTHWLVYEGGRERLLDHGDKWTLPASGYLLGPPRRFMGSAAPANVSSEAAVEAYYFRPLISPETA